MIDLTRSLSLLRCAAVLPALMAFGVAAQTAPKVQVEGGWVRTTVPGQMGTGGFMTLTAAEALQLVGVTSPVAGVAEVHEMKVEGDVMKMRAVSALALPAGQRVELKPGGYHLMLLDLKQPLPKDTTVPVTLVFRDARGAESRLALQLPVSARAPAPTGGKSIDAPPHKH